jgi:osmoprotectant transport system substrate-binding protein
MRQLNYLVEGELRDIKDVVREFRKAKGLISRPDGETQSF